MKAESTRIFKVKWDKAKVDADYVRMKKEHQQRYGG
ncbi:DUF4385 family protein [Paenibacillus ottowii]|nr:hypothetical protein [Paenibacillus ottowii]